MSETIAERIAAAAARLAAGGALSRQDLALLLGYSCKTVGRKVKAKVIPAPDLALGGRWSAAAVRAMLSPASGGKL